MLRVQYFRGLCISQYTTLCQSIFPSQIQAPEGKKRKKIIPPPTHPRLAPSTCVNRIAQSLGLCFPSVLWVKHQITELNGVESTLLHHFARRTGIQSKIPVCFQTVLYKCLKTFNFGFKKSYKNIFIYILLCQK